VECGQVSNLDIDKPAVMNEKDLPQGVGGWPPNDDFETALHDLPKMNLDLELRIQKLEFILGGLRKAYASE
jgi:hypothetical protein